MFSFSRIPAAVWVTYGTRLLGIPRGSSPILAEGWAPIGLKYLNNDTFFWWAAAKSFKISSAICLVRP